MFLAGIDVRREEAFRLQTGVPAQEFQTAMTGNFYLDRPVQVDKAYSYSAPRLPVKTRNARRART
jgi:hypothetical protein